MAAQENAVTIASTEMEERIFGYVVIICWFLVTI